jgi:hypothetical protein
VVWVDGDEGCEVYGGRNERSGLSQFLVNVIVQCRGIGDRVGDDGRGILAFGLEGLVFIAFGGHGYRLLLGLRLVN